jgi:hypothetical protein
METSVRGAKVSVFSRVLAAVLAAVSAFAIVLSMLDLGQQARALGNGGPLEVLFLIAAPPLLFALSAFVAITGRSPRWMTRLEDAYSKRTGTQPEAAQSVESVRRSARLGAVVSCAVLLGVLGVVFNIFSGEASWVGIGIFSIACVLTVALLWRYFGRRMHAEGSQQ